MATGAPVGDFDLFALRQQWAPQWCTRSAMDRSMSWCDPVSLRRRSDGGAFMALHGLWPQFNATRRCSGNMTGNMTGADTINTDCITADWPQFCGAFADCAAHRTAARCELPPSVRASHYEDFMTLAPAWVYQDGGGGLNYGDHEWSKHGSCTGLDAEMFTSDSMGLTNNLPAPAALVARQGHTVDMGALLRMYNFSFPLSSKKEQRGGDGAIAAFACDEGGYLFGVTTCWNKGKDGRPTTRRRCPLIMSESAYSNSCVNRSSILIRAGQPESIWFAPGGALFFVCLIAVASLLLVTGIIGAVRIILRRVKANRELDRYRRSKTSSRAALINYK